MKCILHKDIELEYSSEQGLYLCSECGAFSSLFGLNVPEENKKLEENKIKIEKYERLNMQGKLFNKSELLSAYLDILEIYDRRQMFNDSINSCRKAINLFEDLRKEKKPIDKKKLAETYLTYSKLCSAYNMKENCLENYENGIRILENLFFKENSEQIGFFLIEQYLIGIDLYKRFGKIEKVIGYYHMVIDIMESELIPRQDSLYHDEYGPMFRLAEYYKNFGDVFLSIRMIEKAVAKYFNSVLLLEQLDNAEDLDQYLCAYYDVVRPKLLELCKHCTDLYSDASKEQKSSINRDSITYMESILVKKDIRKY